MSSGWLLGLTGESRILDSRLDKVASLPGPRDPRQSVALAVRREWLYLFVEHGVLHSYRSRDGRSWHQLPRPDGIWDSLDAVTLDPDQGLIFLHRADDVVFHDQQGWRSLRVPAGTLDVGRAPDGSWWAVGTLATGQAQNGCVWQRPAGHQDWSEVPLRLPWWSRLWSSELGGLEQFLAIECSGYPVVIYSEALPIDASIPFVLSRQAHGFRIQRLGYAPMRKIARTVDGRPYAVGSDGELYMMEGRRWRSLRSAQALDDCLSSEPANRSIDLSMGRNGIIGIAYIHDEGKGIRIWNEARSRRWSRSYDTDLGYWKACWCNDNDT